MEKTSVKWELSMAVCDYQRVWLCRKQWRFWLEGQFLRKVKVQNILKSCILTCSKTVSACLLRKTIPILTHGDIELYHPSVKRIIEIAVKSLYNSDSIYRNRFKTKGGFGSFQVYYSTNPHVLFKQFKPDCLWRNHSSWDWSCEPCDHEKWGDAKVPWLPHLQSPTNPQSHASSVFKPLKHVIWPKSGKENT
jgi:hypothetical protein